MVGEEGLQEKFCWREGLTFNTGVGDVSKKAGLSRKERGGENIDL